MPIDRNEGFANPAPRRAPLLLALLLGACGGASGGFYPPPDDDAGVATDASLPSDDGGGPQQTFTASGLTLHVMPQAGLAPLLGAIRGAATSIQVQTYLLTDDSVTDALIAAKRAGRQVQVILEKSPQGLSNAEAYGRLQKGGVAVQWSGPGFTFTHSKLMIVDGSAAWVMTMNFSPSAAATNREYLLVDRDPQDVAEAGRIFDADWTATAPSVQRLVVSPINARSKLDALISGATKEIAVEWEALSDNALGSRLAQAIRAGVAVKIVVPSDVAGTPTGTLLTALKATGAQVRLLARPEMHAKMILVDRARGYIGSVNGTTNSLDRNREVGVLWSQPEIAGQCGATFDADFANGKPL